MGLPPHLGTRRPFYRVVVAHQKFKRDGRFLEKVRASTNRAAPRRLQIGKRPKDRAGEQADGTLRADYLRQRNAQRVRFALCATVYALCNLQDHD